MDFTRTVTHLEFAAGYGGIGLGLESIIPTLRTITYVEIEAFAVANLVAKMEAGLLPVAPVWTNIKTFPSSEFCGVVDILSAGYPCQPFSQAGQRKGTSDERHLWPHIETAIGIIQPGIVFFENVEGHLSLGLDTVLSDLGELGYDVEAGIFSAEEVGAPHQRKRVFILGVREGWKLGDTFMYGHTTPDKSRETEGSKEKRRLQESSGTSSTPNKLANSKNSGRRGRSHSDGDGRRDVPEQAEAKRSMVRGKTEGCSGDIRKRELADPGSIRSKARLSRPKQREEGKSKKFNDHSNRRPVYLSRPKQPQPEWEPPRVIPDSKSKQSSSGDNREEPSQTGNPKQEQPGGGHIRVLRKGNGQIKSSMGGDAYGDSNRLDFSELYTSCDNRTDELRMCGNGVVPATVTKAFITLYNKIIE